MAAIAPAPDVTFSKRTLPFPTEDILILPMADDDLLSAAETAGWSFGYEDNPFTNFTSPEPIRPRNDDDHRIAQAKSASRFKEMVSGPDANLNMVMKIVQKGEEHKVLGAAFWGLPGERHKDLDKSKLEVEKLEAWSDIHEKNWNTLMNTFQAAKDEILKEQAAKCLYLKILFIHTDYQSAGLGKRLLQHGFDYADKFRIPVCLESSKAGRPVYERMGFKVEKMIKVEGADLDSPFMVRWA
ncbi:hypothetical protein LTR62_005266 [Meristemomyces frigidus]|uniref:N-acetyltransferase domain-containing protein n=1 Tax=Meristemomyces frigidus TaxID=1508187 RepID=A0AAN7TEG2_9PEZI|nr:hypothetical protein LTR62_005266 [Meristemomyces frigidus]